MKAALRRIPAPLAALLGVVAIFAVAWVLIVPAWGFPDEDSHFSYSQTLVERGELPGKGRFSVSSEHRRSMVATNTDEVTFLPRAKPEWSRAIDSGWRKVTRNDRRDDGGAPNATVGYPPGYYLYETIPYRITSSADILTRVYVMRFASVLWLLVTTTAAWLLAGEIFGRRRPLQLVTAAAVGLWPMVTWISSAINPDGMLIALWALSTWLAVSLVKRGPSAVRALALCACLGLALVTKASALALLPPVALALVVAAWDGLRRPTLRRAAIAVCVVAPAILIAGSWIAVARHNHRSAYAQTSLIATTPGASSGAESDREARDAPEPGPQLFASYLWQFYLPKLPSQTEIRFVYPEISKYPAYQTWLAGGWGVYGWVNVWFKNWTYAVFLIVTLLALAAAAFTGVRALRRGDWRRRRTVLAGVMLAVVAGALLAGLHWTDYNMYLSGDPPFLQGRYLLPLAPIFALVLAQATLAAPRRFRPAVQGAVLAGLLLFQVGSLGFVAERYFG